MNSSAIMLVMIGICSFLVLLVVFQKQITFLLKFLFRGTIGVGAFYILNLILGFFNFSLGVNLISFAVVGALGMWGFISLIIAQIIL